MAVEVNDEFRPVEDFQPEEFQGEIQFQGEDEDDEGPFQYLSSDTEEEDASVVEIRVEPTPSPEPILAEVIPMEPLNDENMENIPPGSEYSDEETGMLSEIEFEPESDSEIDFNEGPLIESQSETEPESELLTTENESSEELEVELEPESRSIDADPQPVKVWEIMTELNTRSANGRVVVNPPTRMAKLEKRETGEAWYFCERCGRAFLQQDKFLQHRADHDSGVVFEVKPEPVPEEKEVLPKIKIRKSLLMKYSPGLLKSHPRGMSTNPNVDSKVLLSNGKYECRPCKKIFTKRVYYVTHMMKHENVRPHLCVMCGAGFTLRNYLRQHIKRSHSAENQFECPYCTCKFLTEKGMKFHCNLYHLKNAFLSQDISVCNPQEGRLMKARRLQNGPKLKTHRDFRIKTIKNIRNKFANSTKTAQAQQGKNQKPIKKMTKKTGKFQCRICKKVLCKAYTLRQHMTIHTGVRPFRCNHCLQKFRLYTTLSMHIKSAHLGAGSFKCQYCDCSYKTNSVLKAHTKKVHPAMYLE